MLRISGALALLLSAGLGTLLFSRVHTFQATGTVHDYPDVHSYGKPSWFLDLDAGPGIALPYPYEVPQSLTPSLSFDGANVHVAALRFQGQLDNELGENTRVVMTHRSVDFRPVRFTLGATQFTSKGRILVYERTLTLLFVWISLIAIAPIVCWVSIAIPVILMQKHKRPDPASLT